MNKSTHGQASLASRDCGNALQSETMFSDTVDPGAAAPADDALREDARVAYSAAISLWAYEGESAWSRFNAMLVANSILLAFIGFLHDSDNPPKTLMTIIAALGIPFCGLWWMLTARGFGHQAYWVLSAREIEERYMGPAVRTVARGGDYAGGRPVELVIGGAPDTRRLPWAGRLARVALAANLIIGVFLAMYVLLIVWLQAGL